MTVGKVLLYLILAFVLAAAAAVFWLQDANNLKPQIEQLIRDNSTYEVTIHGDMSWQLFPPLSLRIEELHASDNETLLQVARLDLKMDLSAVWQDMNNWQVKELHLVDTQLQQPGLTVDASTVDLMDFRFATPAPFQVAATILQPGNDANQESPGEPALPVNITLDGYLKFTPGEPTQADQISLSKTDITLVQGDNRARGTCDLNLRENLQASSDPGAEGEDDLLPVAALQAYNFAADCQLSELHVLAETFTNSTLQANNENGLLSVMVDLPDFFDGQLALDTTVNTRATPIQWRVLPKATQVDTQRLLAWAEQDIDWIAAVALNSDIQMQGNTPASLAESLTAKSDFDGGQGSLDIRKIKEQLAQVALLSGKSNEVEAWPDRWNYQDFIGKWMINGRNHTLDFNVDNMTVAAKGTYDLLADNVDFLAHITVHNAENSPFRINPILAGTAIPVRCKGVAADPACKVDEGATRSIIAKALQRDDDSGLRAKLEQKIDEKVPEEYQETARSLLELLGRALEESE